MADTPKHSVSVAGIVVDEADRVLVIQRRDNAHWEPPGGVLELDETPEHGLVREVLEETGVKVEAIVLSGVYKNMNQGVIALVFRCRPVTGTGSTSSEAQSVRWISPSEARHLMNPAYSVRVEDAFVNGTSVRCHDGIELVG